MELRKKYKGRLIAGRCIFDCTNERVSSSNPSTFNSFSLISEYLQLLLRTRRHQFRSKNYYNVFQDLRFGPLYP